MDDSDVIVSSTEIIKNKLYFATLESNYRPVSTKFSKYFHIEDEIVYENFYFDYGPYHLCHLYYFCMKLNDKLAAATKSVKIVFYTSDNKVLRLNAAYLIGSYCIIYLKMSAKEAYDLVTEGSYWELLAFRDASAVRPTGYISLLDVFEGLQRAFNGGFFDFKRFNHEEYMYYEKVLNGDLNWIIPDKMLAFSGPHSQSQIKDDYPLHAPEHYHKYFKDNHVTTIVRLNHKSYDAKQFTDYGFDHHELFFLDGTSPTIKIVEKFNKICEEAKGAVAVHCKAGLGRTGTLIACYLMKHFAFKPLQAISWLRICRPGSVIGYQHEFVTDIHSKMARDGLDYRIRKHIFPFTKFKDGIYSRTTNPSKKFAENDDFVDSNSNVSLDDLENVPTTKPATRQRSKSDVDTGASSIKQNKADYVSLDCIINSNPLNPTEPRVHKTRASTALANAKNSYTSNKNNYIISNTSNSKPVTVRGPTFTPKKFLPSAPSGCSPKSKPSCFSTTKISSIHPMKYSIAKNQYGKSSMYSPRANLARNHGQTYSQNAGPLKTYLQKSPNTTKNSPTKNLNNFTTFSSSSASNTKVYDSNLDSVVEAPKKILVTSKLNETKKKVVFRKKLKVGFADQLRDLKNCTISNSDSEKDSTKATLTNISADSLENIPCKMPTKRDKSKSPEPTCHIPESISNGNIEENADSQGSKLCKIKASRKKVATLPAPTLKKEGMKTRNYTKSLEINKK